MIEKVFNLLLKMFPFHSSVFLFLILLLYFGNYKVCLNSMFRNRDHTLTQYIWFESSYRSRKINFYFNS